MTKFVETTLEDIPLLESWIAADPYHVNKDTASWWLTGAQGSYLAFKLVDERGTVVFARFDREGDFLRQHGQFAPLDQVSEKRVAISYSECFPKLITQVKLDGIRGVVTESVSPKLVAFLCNRLGFVSDVANDYKLTFSEDK